LGHQRPCRQQIIAALSSFSSPRDGAELAAAERAFLTG
jgi:hypothetical protein